MSWSCLESIEEAVKWIESNPKPELVFLIFNLQMEFHLKSLRKQKCHSPLYLQPLLTNMLSKPFKVNSIDYILKPIKKSDVEFAINKYQKSQKETITDKNFLDVITLFN
jgi:two-component system response regulator LytT